MQRRADRRLANLSGAAGATWQHLRANTSAAVETPPLETFSGWSHSDDFHCKGFVPVLPRAPLARAQFLNQRFAVAAVPEAAAGSGFVELHCYDKGTEPSYKQARIFRGNPRCRPTLMLISPAKSCRSLAGIQAVDQYNKRRMRHRYCFSRLVKRAAEAGTDGGDAPA